MAFRASPPSSRCPPTLTCPANNRILPRDRDGHSFGLPPKVQIELAPNRWEDCRPYLHGIDLFNRGYYWEAHEVWEGLWHACGRSEMMADFLKGLIALAAAGVKLREGRERGVRQHAARARVLLEKVTEELGATETHYLGLEPKVLARYASQLSIIRTMPAAGEALLVPFLLLPQPQEITRTGTGDVQQIPFGVGELR